MRWNNDPFEASNKDRKSLSTLSLCPCRGLDGPANFIGCNDIICDDICPQYRDTVTLSDGGAICPGAGHQVWAAVPLTMQPLLPLLCSHLPMSGHSPLTQVRSLNFQLVRIIRRLQDTAIFRLALRVKVLACLGLLHNQHSFVCV